jgi:hypothetical protein
MDELCSWFEVIRSLLPQSYEMRLETSCDAIVVESSSGRSVRIFERDLVGRRPLQVMQALRTALDARRLQVA